MLMLLVVVLFVVVVLMFCLQPRIGFGPSTAASRIPPRLVTRLCLKFRLVPCFWGLAERRQWILSLPLGICFLGLMVFPCGGLFVSMPVVTGLGLLSLRRSASFLGSKSSCPIGKLWGLCVFAPLALCIPMGGGGRMWFRCHACGRIRWAIRGRYRMTSRARLSVTCATLSCCMAADPWTTAESSTRVMPPSRPMPCVRVSSLGLLHLSLPAGLLACDAARSANLIVAEASRCGAMSAAWRGRSPCESSGRVYRGRAYRRRLALGASMGRLRRST